jgi:hypothetical protein
LLQQGVAKKLLEQQRYHGTLFDEIEDSFEAITKAVARKLNFGLADHSSVVE